MSSKEFTDWLSGFLHATQMVSPALNKAQVTEILEALSEVHDFNYSNSPNWTWTGAGVNDPISELSVPYSGTICENPDNTGETVPNTNGSTI